jgi:hypothetical protein
MQLALPGRCCTRLLAAALLLLASVPAGAGEPGDYAQLYLELINRARSDPAGEAARYGVGLNDGLPSGTITSNPKQPLAFHELLIDAAVGHNAWMFATNNFTHTGPGGSAAWDRMDDAGYTWWNQAGENISWAGTSAPLTESRILERIGRSHEGLFQSAGHRENMLKPTYEEIGIGTHLGPYAPEGTVWNAVLTTHNFARPSGGGPILTGVVIDDIDDDGFYDPGEGLGGVVIIAERQSDGATWMTTSWSSGGYSLDVPSGTFDVTASGSGFGMQVAANLVVGAVNEKVDFTVPEPTGTSQLVAGLILLVALARRRPTE